MDATKMMLDLNGSQVVQIVVEPNRVWVNVDGLCRLRACDVQRVELEDNRGLGFSVPQRAVTTIGRKKGKKKGKK